jgi:flagellar protein FliS
MKKNAFAAYKQNQLQGIHETSPVKLVALLLDEAIACCLTAAVAAENDNIALKGQSLGKAMAIIDAGLLDVLNYEKGGEIATNMAKVYNYCLQKLASSNIDGDYAAMRECAGLLTQIREGWRAAETSEHA